MITSTQKAEDVLMQPASQVETLTRDTAPLIPYLLCNSIGISCWSRGRYSPPSFLALNRIQERRTREKEPLKKRSLP
jgi:hypothetical protein